MGGVLYTNRRLIKLSWVYLDTIKTNKETNRKKPEEERVTDLPVE